MFDSIYTSAVTAQQFFLMAGVAIVTGIIFAWIISFFVRSSKRFFTVNAILPFTIATVITFVNGNIGAGVAIGGAFALIRFRSAQGSADELASILITMCGGVAFGMGYLAYGVVIMLGLPVIFYLVASLPIFEHKSMSSDRLLRITIPESLEYAEAFDECFTHFLSSWESVGVKTTGMGSMFRLSFKIRMKNEKEEKEFIDELRTRNGNLEISILPYTDPANVL